MKFSLGVQKSGRIRSHGKGAMYREYGGPKDLQGKSTTTLTRRSKIMKAREMHVFAFAAVLVRYRAPLIPVSAESIGGGVSIPPATS